MSGNTVSPLVIRGQRRPAFQPSIPFPIHPDPDLSPPPGGLDDELDGNSPLENPCADPEARREWDTDAAAASARSQFLARAASDENTSLAYRERAAVLYRRPDGSIAVGPIAEGPPMTGSVTLDLTGINPKDVVGFIHVHPGTNSPSPADWQL